MIAWKLDHDGIVSLKVNEWTLSNSEFQRPDHYRWFKAILERFKCKDPGGHVGWQKQ